MNMKKDLIFAPILLLVGAVLCLLKLTGITAHIAVSVVGLVALVVYTVLAKKEWKIPTLEILMRVFYGIALISGVLIMKIHGLAAVGILHKISAVLFLASLVSLLASKLFASKKA